MTLPALLFISPRALTLDRILQQKQKKGGGGGGGGGGEGVASALTGVTEGPLNGKCRRLIARVPALSRLSPIHPSHLLILGDKFARARTRTRPRVSAARCAEASRRAIHPSAAIDSPLKYTTCLFALILQCVRARASSDRTFEVHPSVRARMSAFVTTMTPAHLFARLHVSGEKK